MFKKIKTQTRLKFAKWKIEKFLSTNEVEFVIAHYQEKIDYLDFFPKNSKITIYHKGEKPINKLIYQQYKNVKIINIPNIGRNGHTIFYHIQIPSLVEDMDQIRCHQFLALLHSTFVCTLAHKYHVFFAVLFFHQIF